MTFGDPVRCTPQVTNHGELVALVDRAGNSDPDAWEALYRRLYPGLMAYASKRLDRERARDAVAETMARAVASVDRFEWRGGGFDAWCYGILRHVVFDTYRTKARGEQRHVPDAPGGGDPLEHVLASEEADATRAAFARLGPEDREILELRVVSGLTAEEAGKVLGKRPGAVRMAQSRALERLRHELERRS